MYTLSLGVHNSHQPFKKKKKTCIRHHSYYSLNNICIFYSTSFRLVMCVHTTLKNSQILDTCHPSSKTSKHTQHPLLLSNLLFIFNFFTFWACVCVSLSCTVKPRGKPGSKWGFDSCSAASVWWYDLVNTGILSKILYKYKCHHQFLKSNNAYRINT